MLIAQVSDGHVTEPGRLLQGRYDATARFRRALLQLSQENPRPDFLIHTGDLIHEGGSAQTYRTVRDLLDATGIPYAAIPGNHDQTELMRTAFADKDWLPKTGRLHFVIDHLPVRIVCLDTMIPGHVEGTLEETGLAWLAARLAESPERPVLIAMHHPAFRIGNRTIGAVNFGSEGAFHQLIGRHPNVRLIVAGHVHCNLLARIGPAVALTAPSTAFQFAIERRAGTPFAIADEPPGYCLHDWTAADGFRSQTVPVGDYLTFPPVR